MLKMQIPLFQGEYGAFYIVEGQKYDVHFPLAWALDHKSYHLLDNVISGPKHCIHCRSFGSINGVFIGYCSNCLVHIYNNNERGKHISGMPDSLHQMRMSDVWRKYPYLEGVNRSDIGDHVKYGLPIKEESNWECSNINLEDNTRNNDATETTECKSDFNTVPIESDIAYDEYDEEEEAERILETAIERYRDNLW